MLFLEIVFAVVLLVWLVLKLSKRPANFPPGNLLFKWQFNIIKWLLYNFTGPRGLPLVGYVPFLNRYDPKFTFKSLKKLGDLYGPVVGFYLGPSQPYVSVCGYKAVWEVLRNNDITGRPTNAARQERSFHQQLGKKSLIYNNILNYSLTKRINKLLGISHNEGELWKEQRRFTLRHLRDLGFGKTSSESLIQEEIRDLVSEISSRQEGGGSLVVDFTGLFNLSLINILWTLIGGDRFKRTDFRLRHLLDIVETVMRSGDVVRANIPLPGFLLRNFPFLRKVVGLRNNLYAPLQHFIKVWTK